MLPMVDRLRVACAEIAAEVPIARHTKLTFHGQWLIECLPNGLRFSGAATD